MKPESFAVLTPGREKMRPLFTKQCKGVNNSLCKDIEEEDIFTLFRREIGNIVHEKTNKPKNQNRMGLQLTFYCYCRLV